MASVSSAAAAVTAQKQANLHQDVQIAVQKKAMDLQQASVSQLLNALPQAGGAQDAAAGAANPSEAVGGTVNVTV